MKFSFRLPNQRTVELKETDIKRPRSAPVNDPASDPNNDSASESASRELDRDDNPAEMMTDSQDYIFWGVSSQIDSKDD